MAAIAGGAAFLATSTIAAAAPAPAAQASYQPPNAWLMLTALSPSTAVPASSAAAVQPADVPPPPPPPAGAYAAGGALGEGFGTLVPIALWFGAIAVALTITDHDGFNQSVGSPNSPA